MKLLYTHRTQGKFAEGVHIKGVVNAFRKLGWRVDLISPPGVHLEVTENVNKKPKEKRNTEKGSWNVLASKTPEFVFELLEVAYNLYAFWRIGWALRKYKYDLLYERYSLFSVSCLVLSKYLNIPLVIEVNDAAVIQRSRPLFFKRLAKRIEKGVLGRARLIVTISEKFKSILQDSYGIDRNRILVIGNAIDPERFEIKNDLLIKKEDLGIRKGRVIGFVGAFVDWHGLDFLIHATADILKESDATILLVGDGPVREEIERAADKHNVREYVKITGFVDDNEVPYYIDLMDICVMPNSNIHGSPVKIFEYMAMEKPVVAPRYDPIKQVVKDGINGLLFSPLNATEFRSRITLLLENEEIRRKLGENGKKKTFQLFTWENNVRRILSVLREGGVAIGEV